MKLTISQVRQAIADEPEFPGDMPDDMWDIVRQDRATAVLAFRQAVIATKNGILERVNELSDQCTSDED
jgi:hypothetical protein